MNLFSLSNVFRDSAEYILTNLVFTQSSNNNATFPLQQAQKYTDIQSLIQKSYFNKRDGTLKLKNKPEVK